MIRLTAVGKRSQYIKRNEAPVTRRDEMEVWICKIDLPTAGLHWWPRWPVESCLCSTSVSLDSGERRCGLMCGGCEFKAFSSSEQTSTPEPMKGQLTILTRVKTLQAVEHVDRRHPCRVNVAICSYEWPIDRQIDVDQEQGEMIEDELVVVTLAEECWLERLQ